MRKVVFPFQLDVADMLTPEYAQEKIKVRDELRKVEKEKMKKKEKSKGVNLTHHRPAKMT